MKPSRTFSQNWLRACAKRQRPSTSESGAELFSSVRPLHSHTPWKIYSGTVKTRPLPAFRYEGKGKRHMVEKDSNGSAPPSTHLLVLCTVVPPSTIRTPGVVRFRLQTVSASSYVAPPMMKTIISCGLERTQTESSEKGRKGGKRLPS